MPEYLLFRPPRRQPRLLGLKSHNGKLAIVVLDPWELRFIAEHDLPNKTEKRKDRILLLTQEVIVRERPHAMVCTVGRSSATSMAKQIAGNINLPLILLTSNEQDMLLNTTNKKNAESRFELERLLSENYLSSRLAKSLMIRETTIMLQAALIQCVKFAYENQFFKPTTKPNVFSVAPATCPIPTGQRRPNYNLLRRKAARSGKANQRKSSSRTKNSKPGRKTQKSIGSE